MEQKTILIVDDDADLVLATRLVLESAGYQVAEAANGKAGLAKMKDIQPDLVLMDVMMTNPLDGYHTTQKIAEDPELREIPILMVSSIADTQYAAAFPTDQYLHIVEFISKPVEPEKLLKRIKQTLQ
jgi:CheY-like chemotaxis protein